MTVGTTADGAHIGTYALVVLATRNAGYALGLLVDASSSCAGACVLGAQLGEAVLPAEAAQQPSTGIGGPAVLRR